jgi:hypothetical protein
MPDIVGDPPTPNDLMWVAAAQEVSPAKSLAQIQDISKFLVGSVAVVGTLLTAFGLVGPDAVRRNAGGLFVAVVLAVFSLILALLAAVPRAAKLDLADLAAVESWYAGQILWRGRAATASAITLGLAILIAGVTALVSSFPAPVASTSLQVVGVGSSAKLQAAVHFKGMPTGSEASFRLEGLKGEESSTRLSEGVATPAADGSADLAADIPMPKGYGRFVLTAKVTKDGRTLVTASSALSP